MVDAPFSLRLGFGMLRIDADRAEHREALRDALVAGVDLFDLGDFEQSAAFSAKARLLGALVAEYAAEPVKVLVRGSLGSADRFGGVFADLVPGATARDPRIEWHYLVADPEFALRDLEWDHARLYSLLRYEFDTLEELASRGVLGGYGVASAAFAYAKESPDALALEPLYSSAPSGTTGEAELELPKSGGKPVRSANRRRFKWVEFPFNLVESAAAWEASQSVGTQTLPLLAAARAFGLTTIARRPFDAITEQGLRRLAAYPDHHRVDLDEAVRRTLEVALAEENETLVRANHERARAGEAAETLAPLWANRLRDQLKHVTDPEQWREILRRRIDPDLRALAASPTPPTSRYFDAMEALTFSVRLWCEKAAAERNERLRAKLVEAAPTLARHRRAEDRDLGLLALRIYRSIPGLDYVLVGMRSPHYVRSITGAHLGESAARIPRLGPEELTAVWTAVHDSFAKGTA